jgi:hypothetical protein
MTTSLERVKLALEHRESDRVPLDLGATGATGMHVDSVYALRQALRLDPPGSPVRVVDPLQLLGEIAPDLQDALGVDVVRLFPPRSNLGFKNEDWKPWTTFAGTPVLVPAKFNTVLEPNGDLLQYPRGDRSAQASARMPRGECFFDAIIRQDPIDDDRLSVEDNLEQYPLISDEDLAYMAREIHRLAPMGKAILCYFPFTALGHIGEVPGVDLPHPRGIRDIEEYYVSHHARRGFIYDLFDRQSDRGIQNFAKIHSVVGDRLTVAQITCTDLGAQNGPLISPKDYRELYKPFFTRITSWIHEHTQWKVMLHSCGSIWRLMDDIVDSGFDILNPVQTSAANMDPTALKKTYGDRVTFWGGGIDTQHVLPFGTPDEVRAMVRERMRIFGPDGGFVFATIHNVQARIPVANLIALFQAVDEFRGYG